MKTFWQDCQNCILNFQMNFYGGQFCLNKLQDHCFSSDCGWKSYRRIVKVAFYFSRKTIREEIFVRKKFYIHEVFSFFSWKFFGRVVKTAFYIFRGILWEIFFEKNLYISNFLWAWVENFLAALSKLNSTVPEELFWKSFCFVKKV